MPEKTIKTRIIHKHAIEANWTQATNFVPKQGELIIYDDRYIDKDGNEVIVADAVRYKIGDGVRLVNDLPFIGGSAVKSDIITLDASSWIGDIDPYYQVVTLPNITVNSKIDLQPTIEQCLDLLIYGIALQAVNEDGVVTVYAAGGKPTTNYNIQVSITETEVA